MSRPWACPGGCRWWWQAWWWARPRWSAAPATLRLWPRRWGPRTPGLAAPPETWPGQAPGQRGSQVTSADGDCYQFAQFEDTMYRNEPLVIQTHNCQNVIFMDVDILLPVFNSSMGGVLFRTELSKPIRLSSVLIPCQARAPQLSSDHRQILWSQLVNSSTTQRRVTQSVWLYINFNQKILTSKLKCFKFIK